MDSGARIPIAIERALRESRDSSMSEINSGLTKRSNVSKKLPKFPGNPIQWMHFREAFKLSTELWGSTDRENISRMFEALGGDTRKSVSTLLATTDKANSIIRALDLQFDKKNAIVLSIIDYLKILPDLSSKNQNIIQFAVKLQNLVSAFKSLALIGYVHSPDLMKTVADKLPMALTLSYIRYAVEADAGKTTTLEKLSDFVYMEAELVASAGITDILSIPSTPVQRTNLWRTAERSQGTAIACMIAHSAG